MKYNFEATLPKAAFDFDPTSIDPCVECGDSRVTVLAVIRERGRHENGNDTYMTGGSTFGAIAAGCSDERCSKGAFDRWQNEANLLAAIPTEEEANEQWERGQSCPECHSSTITEFHIDFKYQDSPQTHQFTDGDRVATVLYECADCNELLDTIGYDRLGEVLSQYGVSVDADAAEAEDAGRWTELKRGSEGVSLTLYDTDKSGMPYVVDEMWWTWAEFLQTDHAPAVEFLETDDGSVTTTLGGETREGDTDQTDDRSDKSARGQ